MNAIEALVDSADPMDALKRLEASVPAAEFLTVSMPPFKTYRDRAVITSLESIGWRLLGFANRTAYLQRRPADLPARFGGR